MNLVRDNYDNNKYCDAKNLFNLYSDILIDANNDDREDILFKVSKLIKSKDVNVDEFKLMYDNFSVVHKEFKYYSDLSINKPEDLLFLNKIVLEMIDEDKLNLKRINNILDKMGWNYNNFFDNKSKNLLSLSMEYLIFNYKNELSDGEILLYSLDFFNSKRTSEFLSKKLNILEKFSVHGLELSPCVEPISLPKLYKLFGLTINNFSSIKTFLEFMIETSIGCEKTHNSIVENMCSNVIVYINSSIFKNEIN